MRRQEQWWGESTSNCSKEHKISDQYSSLKLRPNRFSLYPLNAKTDYEWQVSIPGQSIYDLYWKKALQILLPVIIILIYLQHTLQKADLYLSTSGKTDSLGSFTNSAEFIPKFTLSQGPFRNKLRYLETTNVLKCSTF